jgi:glycosyltransferase involved in cell wall biosynthesis
MVVDGGTGLLVPSEDTASLSAALRALAVDAVRRESMGRSGRLRIERQFSLDTMIREYEQLYLQAARRQQPYRLVPEQGTTR